MEVRAYLVKCLIRSLIIPAVVSALLVLIAAPLLRFNPIFLVLVRLTCRNQSGFVKFTKFGLLKKVDF